MKFLLGIRCFFQAGLPVRLPEDVVHLRQSACVEHVHVWSNQVGDAGHDADWLERLRLRRTAAPNYCGPRIRADDGDRLHLRGIERQSVPFVLEQRDALERALQRDGPIGH